jgi:hypothetical protein
MKRTILMTVAHGLVARNLLRTGFLESIKKTSGIRVVILTPGARDRKFREEFESENVIIEDLALNELRAFRENLFNALHSAMVFTETTKIKFKDRIAKNKLIAVKYLLRRMNAFIFGRFKVLRIVLSYLDRLVLPDKSHTEVFEKYRPDLVFVTSLLFRRDFDVLKHGLSRKIKTVGMAKSWDNLVKDIPIRVRPHKIVAWNEVNKKQAIKYQHYDEKDIYVSGIPQFDIYSDPSKFSDRNSFIRKIGGDPSKRLLMFAGAGRWTPDDPDIVKMIYELITEDKLAKACQLLVRPHFAWGKHNDKLIDLGKLKNVIVDTKWNRSEVFPEGWDPDRPDMIRLAESLYHSDMLITSFSTIAIDMSFFNKPIINIAFDGYQKKKANESMVRWYGTRYYKDVIDQDGTLMVYNEHELADAINCYLRNPSYKEEGRCKLRDLFCYKLDGKSSDRIASFIMSELRRTNSCD